MIIDKKLYIQMREPAVATCNNSYLMTNGEILTNEQYKQLTFIDKLQVQLIYKYSTGEIVRI